MPRLLLRVERPIWVTQSAISWGWQCRICPPPACWQFNHAEDGQRVTAMTEAHTHAATAHPHLRPTTDQVTADDPADVPGMRAAA